LATPSPRVSSALVVAGAVLVLAGCGGGHANVTVTPHVSASDEPLKIVAGGLPKRATVTVTVTSTDAAHVRWTNTAKLRTNGSGSVDVPMSVVTGMQPASASLASSYAWPARGAERFRVAISVADTERTVGFFDRRAVEQPLVEQSLTLARDGIVGRYFAPAGRGAHPALLLFGGSEGGLREYGLLLARDLAGHGVAALDVAYWAYPGLPSTLDRIPLEYFARGLRWLAHRPGVDPGHVDVEGISYGSEAALLLGVRYPQLVHAVVASVPSNLATACFGPSCNGLDPAWSIEGRGVPSFSPIPVERIRGPIFAICGTRDLVWPSCPQAQAIMRRRRAHHVPYADTLVSARDAGHYVGSIIPYQLFLHDLTYTQQDADEAGAEIVWPKLVAFLGGAP
jgi:dienelactone hydrolase